MAGARQLPGRRRRSEAGAPHVADQHRHEPPLNTGRTRPRVSRDRRPSPSPERDGDDAGRSGAIPGTFSELVRHGDPRTAAPTLRFDRRQRQPGRRADRARRRAAPARREAADARAAAGRPVRHGRPARGSILIIRRPLRTSADSSPRSTVSLVRSSPLRAPEGRRGSRLPRRCVRSSPAQPLSSVTLSHSTEGTRSPIGAGPCSTG